MRQYITLCTILLGGLFVLTFSSCEKNYDRVKPQYHGQEGEYSPTTPYANGTVEDIDGNVYQTIVIGDVEWMAENLKTTTYSNGDPIINALNPNEWFENEDGAYCWYDNNEMNENLGALYNWFAIANEKGLCPDGWKAPSDNDWKALEMALGMSVEDVNAGGDAAERGRTYNIGGKLKSDDEFLWTDPNEGATDESGFSAVGSGIRYAMGDFDHLGTKTLFWTTTANHELPDTPRATVRELTNQNIWVRRLMRSWQTGLCVRCIREK